MLRFTHLIYPSAFFSDFLECFWCCTPFEEQPKLKECAKCKAVFCADTSCAGLGMQIHQSLECGRLASLIQLAERSVSLSPSILLLAARLLALLAHLGMGASSEVEPLAERNPLLNCFLLEHPTLTSIFALEAHENLLDAETRGSLHDTARMLMRMLNSKLRAFVSIEQAIKLFCLLNINVHGLQFYRSRPLPTGDASSSQSEQPLVAQEAGSVNFGIGLFPTLSLLNHSCQPNMQMAFSAGNLVRLRANQPVKKGERMTISYIDLYLPPLKRRVKLLRSKYFLCTCPRCLTPTSADLEIGAQLCSKCSQGLVVSPLLLPLSSTHAEQLDCARRVAEDPQTRIDLLQSLTKLVGKCQQCEHTIRWQDIKKSESACRQLLKNALDQPPSQRYDSLDALLHRSSTFFSKLHRRHYLITLLQVQLMAASIDRTDNSHQHIAIKHIEHILENVDCIFPPFTLERAAFLEQHGDICQSLAARDPTNKGAFIRLLGQALIFYDRAIEQCTIALGSDHPNTSIAEGKALALRQFIHD